MPDSGAGITGSVIEVDAPGVDESGVGVGAGVGLAVGVGVEVVVVSDGSGVSSEADVAAEAGGATMPPWRRIDPAIAAAAITAVILLIIVIPHSPVESASTAGSILDACESSDNRPESRLATPAGCSLRQRVQDATYVYGVVARRA